MAGPARDWRFMANMDEKGILKALEDISGHLDKVPQAVAKNDWDAVSLLMSHVNDSQEKIRTSDVPLQEYLDRNPLFKKEYDAVKPVVLKKTGDVVATIEEWRTKQMGKIADSKNILDNISRYYQPSNRSYYIDRDG